MTKTAAATPEASAQSLAENAALCAALEPQRTFLRGVAYRITGSLADAEDVVQESFVRTLQSPPPLADAPLRPWLLRVATNLAIDRIRSARRLDVTDEVPEQAEEASQLTGLTAGELGARVEAALKALPERQRLALALFHFEGLSQIEVGQKLGVSDEAVESLLARGRRALKASLANEWRELLEE